MKNFEIFDEKEELEKIRRSAYTLNDWQKNNYKKKYVFFTLRHSYKNAKERAGDVKSVVVKMMSNLSALGVKSALNYILSKSDEVFVENENSQFKEASEVYEEWSKTFGARIDSKEAWHLCFSIQEENFASNLKKLKASVKEAMGKNFNNYQYVMVTHSHQNNPHIHVIINKRNIFTRKKIHFKNKNGIKELFNNVRSDFAIALQKRGLNYTNKNSLEKNLELAWHSAKRALDLTDEGKDKVLDHVNNMISINNKKISAAKTRMCKLRSKFYKIKNEQKKLLILSNEYREKGGGSFDRFKNDLKIKERELRIAKLDFTNAIKNLNNFEQERDKLQQEWTKSFMDVRPVEDLLSDYTYFYWQKYPKHRGATKLEKMKFDKIKKMTFIHMAKTNEQLQDLAKNLACRSIFNKRENIFALNKKKIMLEQNLHLLYKNDVNFEKKDEYIGRLEQNKKFIEDLSEKRFKYIEKELVNNDKAKDFLFIEYMNALRILQKEAHAKLKARVEKEQERKLQEGIKQERALEEQKRRVHYQAQHSIKRQPQNDNSRAGGRGAY